MNPAAEALNAVLREEAPSILAMLSQRGTEIFFPHAGILGQTAEAKGKRYNATIGIALEEDGTPMRLPCMEADLPLPAKDVYPYASSFGKQELREVWREMMHRKNPSYTGTLTLPVVTSGLTHALSVAGSLFLDAGDDLILPDLFWGNYRLIFEHQFGAKLRTFATFSESGFDTGALSAALMQATGEKSVVLLNFPNNPTGYTPTEAEGKEIVRILSQCAQAGRKIVLLLDDAYFGLGFEEGILQESLLSDTGALHENILCVKIDGATKEDYVWGHRVGFVTYAHPQLTPAVAKVLEDKTAGTVCAGVSNACHLSQTLLLRAYRSPAYVEEKKQKEAVLRTRYEAVRTTLASGEHDRFFRALPFNSGYFMCIALANGLKADAVRKTLLQEFDTGVIATGNLLRVAFSSIPTKDIPQLFANIAAACAKHVTISVP